MLLLILLLLPSYIPHQTAYVKGKCYYEEAEISPVAVLLLMLATTSHLTHQTADKNITDISRKHCPA